MTFACVPWLSNSAEGRTSGSGLVLHRIRSSPVPLCASALAAEQKTRPTTPGASLARHKVHRVLIIILHSTRPLAGPGGVARHLARLWPLSRTAQSIGEALAPGILLRSLSDLQQGTSMSGVSLNRQRREIIVMKTAQRVSAPKSFKEVILYFSHLDVWVFIDLPFSLAGLDESVILSFNFYDHNKRSISPFRPAEGLEWDLAAGAALSQGGAEDSVQACDRA